MNALLNKIMGRGDKPSQTEEPPGGYVDEYPMAPEPESPGQVREVGITVRASAESALSLSEIEQWVGDVLGPLAQDFQVNLDEITAREGDGL